MKISFHGIKNAAAQRYIDDDFPQTIINGKFIKLDKSQHVNIHFELTNQNHPDLDEWKGVLSQYKYAFNPNSFDLTYDEFVYPSTLKKERFFVLNDKTIPIKKENFKLLQKIHGLLKRVAQMPDNEIKTEYSYLRHGEEADDAFRVYKTTKECCDEHGDFSPSKYRRMVENCHTPQMTKKGAKLLYKKIEQAFYEYINN